MTRFLSLIVTLPVAVITVLFAVSNLQVVTVSIFPFPFEMRLPLALLVLGTMAFSFLLGSTLTWLLGTGVRARAYREAVRAAKLEKELAALRTATLASSAPSQAGAQAGTSVASRLARTLLPS